MSLVIMILLGSFFLVDSYRQKIIQATISSEQLSRLDSIEFFTNSTERLNKLLTAENRSAWLHLAKLYAKKNADIAYQLGNYYLIDGRIMSAKIWLKESVRQHHQGAMLALANHYFKTKQYQESKSLVLPILENGAALVLLYKLAIQQGDTAFLAEHQETLSGLENSDFYQELVNFSVFTAEKNKLNPQCNVSVQLFATNLNGLRHGTKLITQFQQHKLAPYICLLTPKYIPYELVNCQDNSHEKISCKANVWANRTDISSRYVGLIVEQGGANVDNGIMYIDQQDNVEVLAHELSHLIGFIDEYPLPSQHQKCQQNQQIPFSYNVVTLTESYFGERAEIRKQLLAKLPWASLIKDSTPILTKQDQGWKLTTPVEYLNEIGIFLARSCDKNANIQSYKPNYHRTQLEYFELDFPQSYIDIMALAPNQYLMPSYHFNVSRDLAQQGEYKQAREILRATLFR